MIETSGALAEKINLVPNLDQYMYGSKKLDGNTPTNQEVAPIAEEHLRDLYLEIVSTSH